MPPRRAAVPSIHESIEDRLQRTLQENKQLKQERSDLTEKLQRVQVQFRRLQANLHLLPPEQLQQLSLQAQTAAPTADASTSLPSIGQRAKTKVPSSSQQKDDLLVQQQQQQQQQQQLALTQTQLQAALQEIRRLRATVEANAAARAATTTTPPTTGDASCTSGSVELHRQLAIKSTMLAQREDECRSLREALAAAQMSATQAPPAPIHAASSSSQQVDAMLKEKQQLMQQVSAITAEKGQLMLKARLLEEDVRHAQQLAHNTAVDPEMVVQLQCDVREKGNQLSVLHGRLATTQGQVEALKMECGRLMDELKGSHVAHAETKKALLVLEQERSALQIKCGLMEELEMEVQRKNTEVVRMEQELLKLVASLQSCNRETEAAVRRELATRIEELQAARDGANTERRDIERQLLAARHELEDARRKVVAMQSDVEMYRGQITKIEGEKTNLSQQLSAAEISAKELNDDEVHRAIAIAAIKKRIAHDRGEHMISAPQQGEAGAALDLFESLSWDDQWEQGKLRESLAAAALDLELAETRCQQMATKVEQSDAMAKRVCDERDTLLDENLELRRRVSHVQTVFAKQQLQAYRAAAASERGNEHGMICICIRGLRCEGPAMLCALGLESQTDATNIFFSLEGLAGFDAMISQPFHCLSDVADVFFQYEDLNPDEITLAEVQRTTFVLQLHHSVGEGSTVVAMAELPGMTLLAARELSVEEPLPLISGDGGKLGTAMVELRCARLMLPVLLGQPLSGVSAMNSAEMRAALIALRSVRSLKIQVFRAQGLAQGSHGAPQPYIFYTAQSPSGALSCVRDTVVRPNGTSFTTDPVFDASAVEHRVVVDRELAYFLAHGSIVFVVFDDRASDVRANLGMVEVPLEPLLRSPQTILHRTEPLHPQGTLSFGISWLTTA